MRCQLAEQFGWTFDTIDSMCFDEIESACRMGKKKKGIRVNSAEEVRALSRNWRRQVGL